MSEVLNIMAFLNGGGGDNDSSTLQFLTLQLADEATKTELPEEQRDKILFLIEQLNLSFIPKPCNRRYSPSLLATAAIWMTSSPATYKLLLKDNVLSLPSIRHLKSLTQPLAVNVGLSQDSVNYLEARAAHLNDQEKEVGHWLMQTPVMQMYCAKLHLVHERH